MNNLIKISSMLLWLVYNPIPVYAQKGTKVQKTAPAQAAFFEHANAEVGDELSLIKFKFSKKPVFPELKLVDKDHFLQVELPGVVVKDPGVFIDLQHPEIPKAIFFQTGTTDALLRLFTKQATADIYKRASVDLFHDNLVVTLKPTKLATPKPEAAQAATTLSKPSANTAPPSPPETKATEEDNTTSEFPLDTKLRMIAWISLALFALMIITLTFRRIWLGQGNQGLTAGSPGLKILQSIALAPKYRLSLVQVGKSKYLFSIGPEGVQMVGQPDQPAPLLAPLKPVAPPSQPQHLGFKDRSTSPETSFTKQLASSLSASKAAPPSKPPKQVKSNTLTPARSGAADTKNIQVKIDDEGVHPATTHKRTAGSQTVARAKNKATEDVTRLIREKLKSLPKI
ncbi:MAG: flagellar biosynthetic protein FliO [Zetaproteobacteria bacterium]|nr:flagellar biosynthetic protein FliO [Zetaproteobacteria bacterium]